MKQQKKISSVLIYVWIILFLGSLNVLAADKSEKKYAIKKGAQVTTIKGTTRYWKDVSTIPLNELTGKRRMRPIRNFEYERPLIKKSNLLDPVVQHSYTARDAKHPGISLMPTTSKNFAGMNMNANGSGWPPDTNGDVGINHYIQTVNASMGIYLKSTGGLVSAATFDNFFSGTGITGTPCDEDNYGDPIVLFDPYAQRWFVLDFAWDSGQTDGSYFSIAVSKTSDPTGAWWQYALRADNTLMNDYPKVGIWNDGIYITANMFQFSGSFQGCKIWALKKPDIYNGTLTAQNIFDSSYYAWSILPSNAKGTTAPPTGAPNYMYTYDCDEWGGTDNLV